MAFADSIANDYLIFDGGRDVTVLFNRGGQVESVAAANCTQSPLRYTDIRALGGIALTGREKIWSVPNVTIGTREIEVGDKINDGTDDWEIISTTLQTLENRWRVVARRITPDLS